MGFTKDFAAQVCRLCQEALGYENVLILFVLFYIYHHSYFFAMVVFIINSRIASVGLYCNTFKT